jgi:hypothetical protein
MNNPDPITQDMIVDRLSGYLYRVLSNPDTMQQTEPEETALRDGIVVGLSMSIAIASGASGPTEGHELATLGRDVAEAATRRMIEEGRLP